MTKKFIWGKNWIIVFDLIVISRIKKGEGVRKMDDLGYMLSSVWNAICGICIK